MEVMVCGSEWFRQRLAEPLQQCRQNRVIHSGHSLAAAAMEIKMLQPDLVLFEMTEANRRTAVELMLVYPQIDFVGMLRPETEACEPGAAQNSR